MIYLEQPVAPRAQHREKSLATTTKNAKPSQCETIGTQKLFVIKIDFRDKYFVVQYVAVFCPSAGFKARSQFVFLFLTYLMKKKTMVFLQKLPANPL